MNASPFCRAAAPIRAIAHCAIGTGTVPRFGGGGKPQASCVSRRTPTGGTTCKGRRRSDLTSVFPTMFVRRHDFVRAVDLPDDDAIMNSFASDVNDSIEKYVSRYTELQSLTEVVRAYVVAVHVTNNNESICQRLSGFELLDSEKTDRHFPTFQPLIRTTGAIVSG